MRLPRLEEGAVDWLVMEGGEGTDWPAKVVVERDGVDVMLPMWEWDRDSTELASCGVPVPLFSKRSALPAHARNTVSLIDGVNRDSVRCDSVSVASLRRFF